MTLDVFVVSARKKKAMGHIKKTTVPGMILQDG